MMEGLEFPAVPSWMFWRIAKDGYETALSLMSDDGRTVYSSWFTSLVAESEEEIPDFALRGGSQHWNGRDSYYYNVPVNPEGIRHVADKLVLQYLEQVKDAEKRKPFEADPTPYFGDYR
jgi:hypothetical protein